MLALLERSVTDRGGSYAFCDTDSMGIVADRDGGLHPCPGGPELLPDGSEAVRALSWSEVDRVVERFAALNPYDRRSVPGSILKIEKENFTESGRRRQLWCWAISAKRYVLYENRNAGPEVVRVIDGHEETGLDLDLAKVSEHGLGHLLNPLDPDDNSDNWIRQAWGFLLRKGLGLSATEPEWLNRPALVRVTASSPTVLRWFAGMNDGRSWEEQIKPANFLLLAHPDPLDPSGILPVAPYESTASRWREFDWIDRRDGSPIRVTTELLDGTPRSGLVRVRTYGEILAAYEAHPEAKSLGPDGREVGRRTTGLLRRRPVECLPPVRYIGKEGNRLDERISGLVTGPGDYRTEYVDPARTEWEMLILPVLATMDRQSLSDASGLHRRTIERYIYGGMVPRHEHLIILRELALPHAADGLRRRNIDIPRDGSALLYEHLTSSTIRTARPDRRERTVMGLRNPRG